ncbi:MAG: hypothetical protein J7513_05710 [Solirubrobacteraceae bacterium]|nr:hypothetical protein [Solirubrobacteraceae bacterium]
MADHPHRLDPPIKAVIDATNAGNGKAFAAAFANDATINDWGEVHAGRNQIGKWDREHNSGTRPKLEVTGVSRLGGEILVLLRITRGEETETGTWSFRLSGKQVASLEIG